MNIRWSICLKLILLLLFTIGITPVLSIQFTQKEAVALLCYPDKYQNEFAIKKELSAANTLKLSTVPLTQEENPIIPQEEIKKLYIYNTHQSERYADDFSVLDASYILCDQLREAGFLVVYETEDFEAIATKEQLPYNKRYTISRRYLNEAFVQYGDFDLVIDVHRDSTTRQVSILEHPTGNYARMMFVVGTKNNPTTDSRLLSSALTDKMNAIQPGIMREVFTREAMYNQDMNKNMVLLELGSEHNTISEVYHSVTVLVQAITEYLS